MVSPSSAQLSAQPSVQVSTQVPVLVPAQHAVHVPTRTGAVMAVALGLPALLVALCWAGLLLCAARIAPAGTGHAAAYPAIGPGLLPALWVLDVAAMLLPAALPSVLLYARVKRLRHEPRVLASTLLFTLGGLAVGCGGALAASLAAWLLHGAGALDDAMAAPHPAAWALALVAAGVYQWTPAKHACLEHCRAPLAFLRTAWRPGPGGAFRMGAADARHGAGCWWLLLALPLPAGVLNLPVIGAVMLLALAEKCLPGGPLLACASGLGLVIWGTALLFP